MKGSRSLSSSVARGVAWMLAMRMSLRVLGLISTVILARLLTPEDFGIVAIAMSIFALLHLVKDFGFDTVIIQMREPKKEHYDTAWTFNLLFGMALSVILIISARFVANLYETPALEYLTWAIASLFIIGGLESVGTLDFRKNLTFEKEFWLKIVPKLIGVPCTLILAFWLRNYWSLTIGTIITQVAMLIMGYTMHAYRPKFNLSKARELFNFSKWLMVNNFIYFANNRSPELIIGKLLNPQSAGFFAISNEIGLMVTTEMSSAVSRASYPGYAKVASNKNDLKNLYINVFTSASFFLFPVALGFCSVVDLIVPIFLGNQWLTTIPLMQMISIGGLLMALNSNAGYVFMAIGNPRISTLLGMTRIAIFIPLLVYFLNSHGLEGAACAVLLTTIIMFIVTNTVVVKYLPISFKDILLSIYRPFISSGIMVVVLNYSESVIFDLSSNGFIQLVLKVFLGITVFTVGSLTVWLASGRKDGIETKIVQLIAQKLHKYGYQK